MSQVRITFQVETQHDNGLSRQAGRRLVCLNSIISEGIVGVTKVEKLQGLWAPGVRGAGISRGLGITGCSKQGNHWTAWNLVSCLAGQYKISRQTEERREGAVRSDGNLGYESDSHLLHPSPHCAHCRSLWCARATEGHIISQTVTATSKQIRTPAQSPFVCVL